MIMRKLLNKCIRDLKKKEEKVNITNDYIKQLEYLNRINGGK